MVIPYSDHPLPPQPTPTPEPTTTAAPGKPNQKVSRFQKNEVKNLSLLSASLILATTFPPITPSKITTSSLVALSPWNILLSWKIPDGVNPLYVLYYEITGSLVHDVKSKTVYNVMPISQGIIASSTNITS